MLGLGARIVLIKMIIKNVFSKSKIHYPSWYFLEFGEVKKDWILIKILNKQTKNKFINEWSKL